MNELFASIFLKLEQLGDVTEANLYKSGDFSSRLSSCDLKAGVSPALDKLFLTQDSNQ